MATTMNSEPHAAARRTGRFGGPCAGPALGRHEAEGGTGSGAGLRSRHSAHGRAVQRARPADPPPALGLLPRTVAAPRQDGDLHNPGPRQGDSPRRPHRHHEGRPDCPVGASPRYRLCAQGRPPARGLSAERVGPSPFCPGRATAGSARGKSESGSIAKRRRLALSVSVQSLVLG